MVEPHLPPTASIAVASDFYHRHGDRIDLPETAEGREQGFRLLAALDRNEVTADTRAVLDHLDVSSSTVAMVGLSLDRGVRAGREREFENFLSELHDVFADASGHLRLTIIRPQPPDREYTLVYQFDSQSSLLAWEHSHQRAAAIARSAPLTEHPPRERLLTGMETWFAAPTGGIVKAPPRWKPRPTTARTLTRAPGRSR